MPRPCLYCVWSAGSPRSIKSMCLFWPWNRSGPRMKHSTGVWNLAWRTWRDNFVSKVLLPSRHLGVPRALRWHFWKKLKSIEQNFRCFWLSSFLSLPISSMDSSCSSWGLGPVVPNYILLCILHAFSLFLFTFISPSGVVQLKENPTQNSSTLSFTRSHTFQNSFFLEGIFLSKDACFGDQELVKAVWANSHHHRSPLDPVETLRWKPPFYQLYCFEDQHCVSQCPALCTPIIQFK